MSLAHALLKQANNRARHAAQDPALERFASDPHLLAHATADVTFGQSLDLVFRGLFRYSASSSSR